MPQRPYIAVVDDDEGMCRALMRLLHSSDMEVATFHRGREMLLAINRREPDCVVIDIELPDFKELDLFDWIHGTHPDVPVIVITAWEDEDLRLKAIASGASGFFFKPFTDDAFLDTIHAAIARARAQVTPPEFPPADNGDSHRN